MRSPIVPSLLLTLGLFSSPASAQTIGVFFDADATQTSGSIGVEPFELYILLVLGGPASGGFGSAEFRVDGMPAAWSATPTPSPASTIALGNPLAGGTNIAFPDCESGANGVVLLFTVNGWATTLVGPTCLVVREHGISPSLPDPGWGTPPCPVLALCGNADQIIEAYAGTAMINGSSCPPVAVEAASWSAVKKLYP